MAWAYCIAGIDGEGLEAAVEDIVPGGGFDDDEAAELTEGAAVEDFARNLGLDGRVGLALEGDAFGRGALGLVEAVEHFALDREGGREGEALGAWCCGGGDGEGERFERCGCDERLLEGGGEGFGLQFGVLEAGGFGLG